MFAIFLLELTCHCASPYFSVEARTQKALFVSSSWKNCELLAVKNGWLLSPNAHFCLCPRCLAQYKNHH